MDDFEKAIYFSFDQSGAVDENLRAQAMAYCEQVKRSPSILHFCLEKYRASKYAEVQFWCFQTLEEVLRLKYTGIDLRDRMFLKSALLGALSNYDSGPDAPHAADESATILGRPSFVRNKLAQIIVILVRLEYPTEWPSVFLDILSLLSKGPGVVDMLCRILISLDEEIISLEYPRTSDEIAIAMRIKDAMRQQCITRIAEAWYSLIMMYKGSRMQLVVNILETMHRYVSWIDINLVANDSFIPLFFEFLTSPHELLQVRCAAADCLLAIVSKRMDVFSKLALLQQLRIGHVCSQIVETQDSEFLLKLTALLTGLATEVLECSKKMDLNGVSGQPVAVTQVVVDMLDEILPSVFLYMQSGDEEISTTTFQFLSNYIARMKGSNGMNIKQETHVRQILELVRRRMRYDSAYRISLDKLVKDGEEEECRMIDYRKDLFTLFRNIYRVAPAITKSFVKNCVATFIKDPEAAFEDVEAGLMLFYVIGEGMTEDELKSNTGAIQETIAALLSMIVPCHSHRLISLLYLDIVIRYIRFVQHHVEFIPSVLATFLDARGVYHQNPFVRNKASYLFMRLVKVLRSQLTPYLDSILQGLQGILSSAAFTKQTCGNPELLLLEDRSYAFEAVGLLLGTEDLTLGKQEKYLSALLVPLCAQADAILASRALQGNPTEPSSAVLTLQYVISSICYLSKGFGEQLVASNRPALGIMFIQVISFLHRMVETLGSAILPYLPATIQQLLSITELKDVVEFILLMNQLIHKFKVGMKDILQEVAPAIMVQVSKLLPKEGLPDGLGSNIEEIRELQELQRVFLTFLHAITLNDISSVLVTQNSQGLNDTIQLLYQATCNHKDILVRKVCIQVLAKLIMDWCGSSSEKEKVPGFRRFVIEQFAAECCIFSVLQNSFDLRDVNTVVVLGEIVAVQRIIYEKYGDEFLMQLANQILPAAHCPPNLAEQYCLHIQRSDVKDLKIFFKSFVEKLRPEYNCKRAST
ncbi:hypothetical protein O6H91_02G091900 [Diphasiastrum complanatum]|uniref:Uncharacterized protein n=1 Tax=Diphasiastrum complanatum TaxID=34168 RepID=A0ACC2EHZ7_DIPCM|nr:hypothetical protein O6H91_02G091900 [Diphasiastrum complanatum]